MAEMAFSLIWLSTITTCFVRDIWKLSGSVIYFMTTEREREGNLPRLRKMVLVTLSSWQLLMLMLARVVLTNVLSVIPTYFTSRALICTGKCSHVK